MKITYTTKYFPFSPGIPWKCQNGIYVMTEISAEAWENAVGDRKATVLAYGGLLEAFYSLTILEALNKQNPSRSLFWSGNDVFNYIVWLQGLAKPIKSIIDQEKTLKYPVPMFLDKGETVYFNCLHNYIIMRGYFRKNEKPNKLPAIRQIFNNSLLEEWDFQYNPKFRVPDEDYFLMWAKQTKFHPNKPYIVIFPSKTPYSLHEGGYLGWNDTRLREIGALLSQLGISVVVCSDYPYDYNIRIHKAPYDLRIIFNLLKGAKGILSDDIDPLLIGLSIANKAMLFCRQDIKNVFDLYDNAEFLGAENVIFTSNNELAPMDVYMMLESVK